MNDALLISLVCKCLNHETVGLHAAMNFNDTGSSFLIDGLVQSLVHLENTDTSLSAAELVQLCIKMIFVFGSPHYGVLSVYPTAKT